MFKVIIKFVNGLTHEINKIQILFIACNADWEKVILRAPSYLAELFYYLSYMVKKREPEEIEEESTGILDHIFDSAHNQFKENFETEDSDDEDEPSSILDDIYDIAHDLLPDATESFKERVSNRLERIANYFEDIAPSWESACDRIYNKVMNFLDDAEEKSIRAVDRLQHSSVGFGINKIYERNHRERG